MPHYQYSGRDNTGALVSGNIDAGTADDVATKLFGDRVTPIEILEVANKSTSSRTGSSSGTGTSSAVENITQFFSGTGIGIDDLIMFSRQMFSLAKAGLPLDRALKGLEASLTNLKFQRVLKDVIVGLENGMSLAAALGRHPKVFSQLFLSLIHVGENTGRLDLAFKEVGKYLELEKQTRQQIKSATRYPMFVLAAITVALAVITVFVIPVFADTFERLGAQLPWQTVLLIDISNFVVNYWLIILLLIGGSIVTALRYVNSESGRLVWDRKKLGLPLAGNVFERIALARFSRTFSMVMRAGVPIVQGLTIVAGAVGNAFIGANVILMREGVERGESLYRTATNSKMFSPLVLQMISVGEETGTIDELLTEAADFYDAEVEYDLRRLSDAIEPILISFIAVLVLILALGVFLPIWDLNSAIN